MFLEDFANTDIMESLLDDLVLDTSDEMEFQAEMEFEEEMTKLAKKGARIKQIKKMRRKVAKENSYLKRLKKKKEEEARLARKLCHLLRHDAFKEGFDMSPDGFVFMDEIMSHRRYGRIFTFEKLHGILQKDTNRIFSFERYYKSNEYMIRANKGHTMRVELNEICVKMIKSMDDGVVQVYCVAEYNNWPTVKEFGLQPFGEKFIHFQWDKGDVKEEPTVKPRTYETQLVIYLDVEKILKEGKMRLYLTTSDTILCSGIQNSSIPPFYFKKVIDRCSGRALPFPRSSRLAWK